MKTSNKGFITKKDVIAVIGVSANPEKWGRKIYEKFKKKGFKVYPINPKHGKINNEKCYPNLRALPEKPTLVMTVVPPIITEEIVKECAKLGIGKIWMQPGSESKKAIELCEKYNIKYSANTCVILDRII